jgi:hypothetical protein
MRLPVLIVAAGLSAFPLAAQQQPAGAAAPAVTPRLSAAPSTRATATLSLSFPRVPGQPAAKPLTVVIDYGQPHARGRAVPTELATPGTIWRTGANTSTTLTTEANLVIGGTPVPAGAYSLYTIREGDRYLLIINRNTGQWGTEYDQTKDLARVPLRATTNAEVRESLQIAMVPAAEPPAKGVLTIAWGKLELSTDWSLR